MSGNHPLVISDVPPSAERIASDMTELGVPLPSSWLDRLLLVLYELPFDDGREAISAQILHAVAEMFPEHAFGVCLLEAAAEGREATRIVIRRGATGDDAGERTDPTRLFPVRVHERASPLGDALGSTFHVAHDQLALIAERSVEGRFFDRVAVALSGTLRQAAIVESARSQSEQLQRLQQQVIQSEKLASLGQIAAGVVHELNNPLTSIVVYSDYLRRKADHAGADVEDIERLRRIGEAAERILRFSRDLVDYARPSSGVPSRVKLHDYMDQAILFCEHVLGKTGVEIERDYADELPPVLGVGGELTQVFVNLITNACHALPEAGGRLILRTRAEGDFARVEVIDNGHGIEDDLLGRIFEPFFTTKVEGRGTGLGLSIVKNIVTRHGGTVYVESGPTGGSKFVVALPFA